jgi:hypothetical protein
MCGSSALLRFLPCVAVRPLFLCICCWYGCGAASSCYDCCCGLLFAVEVWLLAAAPLLAVDVAVWYGPLSTVG